MTPTSGHYRNLNNYYFTASPGTVQSIPREIVLLIFSYLTNIQLLKKSLAQRRVCKQWNNLIAIAISEKINRENGEILLAGACTVTQAVNLVKILPRKISNCSLRFLAAGIYNWLDEERISPKLVFQTEGLFWKKHFTSLVSPLVPKNEFTDHQVKEIITSQPLEKLDLSFCPNTSDGTIETIALNSRLTSLSLIGAKKLTGRSLIHISGLTGLTQLNLKKCPNIGQTEFARLANLSNLEILDLSSTNATAAALCGIVHLKRLRVLKLAECQKLTDEAINPILGCSNLLKLDLKTVSTLSPLSLMRLTKLTLLTTLKIGDRLNDEAFACISSLTSLKKLDITNCSKLTNITLEKIDDLFPHLKTLILEACIQVNNRTLLNLAKNTNLHQLNLENCSEITSEGIAHLSDLKALEALSLSYCTEIDGRAVQSLAANNTALRSLSLKGCKKVNGKNLIALKSLPNLIYLATAGCSEVKLQQLQQIRADRSNLTLIGTASG